MKILIATKDVMDGKRKLFSKGEEYAVVDQTHEHYIVWANYNIHCYISKDGEYLKNNFKEEEV